MRRSLRQRPRRKRRATMATNGPRSSREPHTPIPPGADCRPEAAGKTRTHHREWPVVGSFGVMCKRSGSSAQLVLLHHLSLVVELPVQAGEELGYGVQEGGAAAHGQTGHGDANPLVAQVSDVPGRPHIE